MITCPFCKSLKIVKNGWYKNNFQRVQKYYCNHCRKDTTEITEIVTKYEHKPELNDEIIELHRQGISQREIASRLDCSRTTVQRKIKKYS